MTDKESEAPGKTRLLLDERRLATANERNRVLGILRAARTPAAVVQFVEQGATVAEVRTALGVDGSRQSSGVWSDVTRRLNERHAAKAAATETTPVGESAT